MSDKVKVVNPFLFPFAKVWYHAVQMPVYKLKRWWHRLNYIEGIYTLARKFADNQRRKYLLN
jgi:hypothetical protein